MSDFYHDRDKRGEPLEILIANHLAQKQIPFGFNPFSKTDDARREEYDIYIGQPENDPILLEVKLDWLSAITGNLFIEEKTLRNTHAHKIAYGRLFIDVFDTEKLRQMYALRNSQFYAYKHVIGGDQPDNRGMLLDWKACKANSQPFWLATKQLTQQV